MLEITIPENEMYNPVTGTFITSKETTVRLEHSLVAISKWESKWHKPFLEDKQQSDEQLIDYIRCMCITQNVDPNIFYGLSEQNLKDIIDYINDPKTATTISSMDKHSTKKEIITSELIYYWMVTYNIPFECQKWHINRLLMLIGICNVKNQPGKKMSKSEIMRSNNSLNAARRAAMHSKG